MTQGLILAAGMGRRMRGMTNGTPKSLMRMDGEALIHRNIRLMFEAGIERVIVVVGYEGERFSWLADEFGEGKVVIVENDRYATTNTISSLWAARAYLDQETYITTADILLRDNPYKTYRDEKDFYLLRPDTYSESPDWIANLDDDLRFVSVDKQGHQGHSYTGISHWTPSGARLIAGLLEKVDWSDPAQAKQYWDELLLPLLDEFDLRAVILNDDREIYEFDSFEDIERFQAKEGKTIEF